MPPAPPTSPALCPPSSSAAWRVVLPLALFAVLWVDLCRQLSYTWETNEQYGYGWFVPFFALALFIRRWPTRPSPLRLVRGEGQGEVSPAEPATFNFPRLVKWAAYFTGQRSSPHEVRSYFIGVSVSAFVLLLCLLLLPLRVIIEINPDWPLITWPYTLIVVLLTLYAVHLADPFQRFLGSWNRSIIPPGSVSAFSFSPWLLHFAFPICFILVAIQWPYRIEKGLTQNLMQIVASLTVEIIGWFGIPALQRGNLIELSTGVLGVDEACSGIRSFQSTLMAALFLGELYLLRWPIRLLLIVAGLASAFLLNVCRTLILTWQANAHGISAIDKWHDPAGFTIAIACFGVLWLLAVLIKKRWSASDSELSTFNSQPPEGPPSSVIWRRYAAALGLWSLLCIIATEIWYRGHAANQPSVAKWTLTLPENNPGFSKVELGKRAIDLLQSDVTLAGRWQEQDGSEWHAYFLRWRPKGMRTVLRARGHSPELCLPGAGLRQVFRSDLDYLSVGQLELPFHKYVFDAGAKPLHVFFCLWEDGAEHQRGMRILDQFDRLAWAFSGKRRMGQQTLEIIVAGYANLEEAERAVRMRLPNLIRIDD